ncbi:DNA polymerase III subunit delta [Bacteroidetes bacterium endosymbiont of Geopemphigus sp.]|uniref:DNA polymerase III subunit delta n=1 Tax=Bacteroidetes bacterium endosymbiont of Geopemphigus sp. TaxID=2047937 RepID=UPI000CD21D8D|nr:DNA polymerase III subunit delta [Bacteroidetes bacterium endosymbiont of Geopemphigus sp.]
METPEQILTGLKEKKYKPIYFLMGEESYYIDLISDFIEKNVLSQEEKAFNQTILYAGEIDIPNLIAQAKRYPMMSPYTVLIIKEAQLLSKTIEKLSGYIQAPLKSTLLVICYKNKVLDRRQKICKLIQQEGVLFESKKYPEYQIPDWIEHQARSMKRRIGLQARHLLAEHSGTSLSTLARELEKIYLVLSEGAEITTEVIAQYTGISKRFNPFEWQKAIAEKNFHRAQEIAWHFGKNPKEYPVVLLINTIYRFFVNLVKYHLSVPDKQANLSKILNVPPYFIKDYEKAAYHYSLTKSLKVFSYLREADRQVKGIDCPYIPEHSILQELTYKIFI